MPYNPDFNPRPYSTAALEARGRQLLFRQINGTSHQRNSPGIAGELAVINAELVARFRTEPATAARRGIACRRLPVGPATPPRNQHSKPHAAAPVPRSLNHNRLDVAPADDVAVAPWQPYTPSLAPRPVGGYTGAVRSVTADFNPAHNSQYR